MGDDTPPTFTQKPLIRQEDDGNKLVFECQLLSKPKPTVEWYREDTRVLGDGKRIVLKCDKVSNNKYTVTLELVDVVESDAGLYKVKVKNILGEVSASICLNFARESC